MLYPRDGSVKVEYIPTPAPSPTEVLVRVGAAALNPIDYVSVQRITEVQERRVLGSDFAGTVVDVRETLKNSTDKRAKVGNGVAGCVQGGECQEALKG